ncbi:NAD(P)-dependent oxidoreductase|uniref:3-hydroxyisobutyrate dehydrogenase n=1 Tax=Dendrosporobacter quercicolus TaxID=146817 RepID=A0A1G9SHA5_9FIRM|nr:NAD(P)-dependent oxidoreductase [Dendrosporobacter quercicolus]NSL48714.1 NAD(P)-dependent oxidoreductase [Dendrosporobacter quercicolus DSM 1736]SDM34878.1 3-hydroxyisobutyrate dehydrogenase [Dendrosporobacter quercicolus]
MSLTPKNTVIGFIGTGVMGKSMAGHLLKAGYSLKVYNRTKAKAQELLEQGALWSEKVAELAAECQVIITMIGYPKDVEAIYFGNDGLLYNAKPGTYLLDMTTSSPELAVRIEQAAKAKSLQALDAPVSGGDVGAKEARLAIMVGGESEAFAAVRPILELMGKNIVLQGPAGAGQHTKMCNQIAIAANMMGVCEAMAYAQKAGLDPKVVLQSIETGAAGSWSLSNLAPRMLAGNFEPGFYIKHFIKDMRIAIESAQQMGLNTPALDLAVKLYEQLAAQGEENSGTQALFKYYR